MFPLCVPGRKRLWLLVLLAGVFQGAVFETSKLLNLAALRAPSLCGPSLGEQDFERVERRAALPSLPHRFDFRSNAESKSPLSSARHALRAVPKRRSTWRRRRHENRRAFAGEIHDIIYDMIGKRFPQTFGGLSSHPRPIQICIALCVSVCLLFLHFCEALMDLGERSELRSSFQCAV